jgi:hypothetical protein
MRWRTRSTRQAAQTGRNKVAQDCLDRLIEKFREGHELAGTKAMDIESGVLGANMVQQIQIPLLGQLRMVTALHEHLGAAQREGFLDLAVEFVERDDIRVGVLLGPPESTELAVDVADVGVVDVAIDDVRDGLRTAPSPRTATGQPPPPIRQGAQLRQGQGVQGERFRGIDSPPLPNPLQ